MWLIAASCSVMFYMTSFSENSLLYIIDLNQSELCSESSRFRLDHQNEDNTHTQQDLATENYKLLTAAGFETYLICSYLYM